MIPALLALTLAAQPRVFLSVDRAFLPDSPGTVVRAELEGASTLDVRLYQLKDPERFLGAGDEPSAAALPAANAPRAPSPPAVLARGAVALRVSLRDQLDPLLTPAAQAALRLLAPGELFGPPRELPFLRGEPLIRRWTLPCGGDEEHRYCDVELGGLPSGVYLVEGVAGEEVGYAVVLVSRLALAARHLPGELVLFAADARSGEPISGVSVDLSGSSGAPLHGTTNADGMLPLRPQARSGRALAHSGKDWAVLELPAIAGRGKGPRLWIAPTRGEARPGERVRFIGAERPPPPSARELAVSLQDGRGTTVATGTAHQDAFGLFSGALTLPFEAAPGLAHLVVAADGRQFSGELWIRDPPRADLTADAKMEVYGAKVGVEVHARDGVGAPVAATVEWHLLRAPLDAASDAFAGVEPVEDGEATTGPDGVARFEVAVPEGPDARLRLEATAVDGWEHRASCEASAVKLVGPLHVALLPERKVYAPGEAPKVRIEVTDGQGAPSAAAVTVRTRASRIGASSEATTLALGETAVQVPPSGEASVTLAPVQPGYYELEASLGTSRVAEAVLYATAHGGDIPFTPDALTLVPDRPAYSAGETARVLLFAPFESGSALVTVESGEMHHRELARIRGSSALYSFKVPAGTDEVTLSAVAILNGQSYAAERALPVKAGAPGHLRLELGPAHRAGQLELRVHATDAQGRPLANVSALGSMTAGESKQSLAPPLGAFLEPPPAPDGRTDVSLDFRSAGASGPPEPRPAPSPPLAFTPEKGLAEVSARAPHAMLDLVERLPPTDRAGNTHLAFSPGDAAALTVRVVAAVPANDPHGAPALLQADLDAPVGGITAVPMVPTLLRANDRALAQIALHADGGAGTAMVGGRSIAIASAEPSEATLSLDAQHPELRVEASGRTLLQRRIPVTSGEEWVAVQAGEAPSGVSRLAGESEEGTLRLRVVSGPAGLLRLMADARRPELRGGGFERPEVNGGLRPEADARLSALATALAAGAVRPDASALSAAAAAVIAQLSPAGELGAYPGAPFDATRTALALWLLGKAQAAGAGVSSDWMERMASRLATAPASAAPAIALARAAPLPDLDEAALGALDPAQLAQLVVAAADRSDARAERLAVLLEKRAGLSGNRACWAPEGCDPRTPASIDSLASTAWAALALAHARPRSPRIAPALRYLLITREQAVWGRAESGVVIPLALAAGASAMPDRAATVHLTASGDGATARLEPGNYTVLYASGGPASLRVEHGPVFFELAHARAEPSGEQGELRVERRYYRVHRSGEKVELEPLTGELRRGDAVRVELTVTGAAPQELVQIVDRFPAGLFPIAQPAGRGPAAELEARGGAVSYLGDKVHFDAIAGAAPLTVAYLARATLAGHYLAPAATAIAGELGGRSAQAELDIEASP